MAGLLIFCPDRKAGFKFFINIFHKDVTDYFLGVIGDFLYHFYSNKQDRREKILEMTYYSKPIKKD